MEGITDSLADYGRRGPPAPAFLSESSSARSVTPPLPPLSPSSSQPGSAPTTPRGGPNRQPQAAPGVSRPHGSQQDLRERSGSSSFPGGPVPRTPDLLVSSATHATTTLTSTGVDRKRGGEGGGGGGGVEEEGGGTRGGMSRGHHHHHHNHHERGEGGGGGSKYQGVPSDRKSHGKSSSRHERESRGSWSRQFARSRSLDDVRESGNESPRHHDHHDHDLSFDVETTVLTIAPSDLSELGEGGGRRGGGGGGGGYPGSPTTASSYSSPQGKDPSSRGLRGQLSRLENMYHDVVKLMGADKGVVGGGRGGRRWSIASSDTSSLRKGARHFRGGAAGMSSSGSSKPVKDLRSIQRRFQRLESHVVTLARSLGHLSSELKAHNALRRDLDLVKREVRELKQQGAVGVGAGPGGFGAGGLGGGGAGGGGGGDGPGGGAPFEKFRGWIPSLTNPKRINKLTQFFGQEPPLLEIFLKKLGYERYAKNFAAEHIGMIELPYMTEERLESIGIPMGPRLRILQESQLCFRQENFDIYIV
ncbi:uncharacterized protein LOC143295956 [Babylonia areolata]|uniref:uncharacterized protein LOC143295956 n=1 Tax=Babylonia areolata TaxID=304850 RepID=UPI003FCFF81B